MASVASYTRSIEAARAAALSLSRSQERAFLRLLETYAEDLATRVAAGLATRGEKQALAIAQEIIQQLTRDLAVATRNGVNLSAERVAQIYAEATANLIGADAGGGLGGLAARAAQAVLSRPTLAASFRSIQRDSIKAVDRIIHRALLRGISGAPLGRELRLHILGADAFPARLLLDRRRIGYEAIRAMGYEATPANLAAVRKDAGLISNRAQLIARTEPMNAEWEVHMAGAAASPVVRAIRWRTSRRHAQPDVCDVLAGTDMYGLGPGLYDPRQVPPRPHPRCFVRGTHVQGLFARGFRSQYAGDVVHVETFGGKHLTVTPNHPVLTPRGFVAAHQLHEGAELVGYRGQPNAVGVVPRAHERLRPTPIEEVFRALREAGQIATQQRAPEYFHGDARFGQGDIDVVGAAWELEFGRVPTPSQLRRQGSLVPPDVELPAIPGLRRGELGLERVGLPALRPVSARRDPLPEVGVTFEPSPDVQPLRPIEPAQLDASLSKALRQRHPTDAGFLRQSGRRLSSNVPLYQAPQVGDFHPLRFGAAAQLDASVFQPAAYGVAGDAKLLAELRGRCAGAVEIDHVRQIRRATYFGHVYDLQAMNGFVVAGGILCSNCICIQEDVLYDDPADWGKPRGEVPRLRQDPADLIEAHGLPPSQLHQLSAALFVAERRHRVLRAG